MKIKSILVVLFTLCIFVACDDTTDTLGTSLSDRINNITVTADTFDVVSISRLSNAVINRSNVGYLGYVKDPETNSYISGDFLTQFHTIENYTLPDMASIMSRKDGKIVADSCEIRLYYRSFYGDSLETMKVKTYELSKRLPESTTYFSDFDPIKEDVIRENGLTASTTYSLADMHVSSTDRNVSTYIDHITIPLTSQYVDKNNNQYDNFGTYVMRTYYEHPEYFKNSYQLANNVIPGFYFKHSGGIGSMAYITSSALNIYFRYTDNDSTYNSVITFAGTEEVLQTSHITNSQKELEALVADNTCTYLKTPAGIYTELTLPVDEIIYGHENDTINTAKLVIPRINNDNGSSFSLPCPQHLLIIPADSVETFFENNMLPDNKYSFIADYSTTKSETTSVNSYTFSNISSLVSNLAKAKREGMKSSSNWLAEHPNWNKLALIPVAVTQVLDATTQTYEIVKVNHDLSLSSTRIVGGTNSNNGKLKLSVIYSKFTN